jgi:hypothetical protein
VTVTILGPHDEVLLQRARYARFKAEYPDGKECGVGCYDALLVLDARGRSLTPTRT